MVWFEHVYLDNKNLFEPSVFNFLKMDPEDTLNGWFNYLNEGARIKLQLLFLGRWKIDIEDISFKENIHPKHFLLLIFDEMYAGSNKPFIEKQLHTHYLKENRPIHYLEEIKDLNKQLDYQVRLILNTIKPLNISTSTEQDLSSSHIGSDWAAQLNALLQDDNYEKLQSRVQAMNKPDNSFLKEPIRYASFRGPSDERTKAWGEKYLEELNDCVVICGKNHVLRGLNAWVKQLEKADYMLYLVDNRGNETPYKPHHVETCALM